MLATWRRCSAISRSVDPSHEVELGEVIQAKYVSKSGAVSRITHGRVAEPFITALHAPIRGSDDVEWLATQILVCDLYPDGE